MRDRILGLVVVIVAATMAWNARDMVPPFAYEPVGPRAFPWLLAAMLALFGLWLIVRPIQPAPTGEAATRILPLPVLFAFATVVAYGLLFQWLGFPIATMALGLVIGRLFGASWIQAVLTGVALGVGFFLLFDRLLDVVLPLGLLRSVL